VTIGPKWWATHCDKRASSSCVKVYCDRGARDRFAWSGGVIDSSDGDDRRGM
jgi:hypothetical protein